MSASTIRFAARRLATCAFALCVSFGAQAQISVNLARIGCLDIQKGGNLTAVVAKACNGKSSCTYKAPDEDAYKRLGVKAATRSFCTQGMQIVYHCGKEAPRTVNVDGDAWNHPPAQLFCALAPATGAAAAHEIQVTKARIGCLDIQVDGNLTGLVANACNNKVACAYKAPTEAAYKSAGISARTRTFCTQGMEITYRCGTGPNQLVAVPGDAWNNPPAQLRCLDIDPSTYRAKNGYDFRNSDAFQKMVGGYDWNDLKELYGKCAVNLDLFGFCEIPDPLLAIYIPILNNSFQGGQCFGFSLSSLRFLNGTRSVNDFPLTAGGKDAWHLNGPGFTDGKNVSPNLSHYVHLNHILQASAEAIHFYIGSALGAHTNQNLKQDVSNALSTHGAILCMSSGGGHCVVPYAVLPLANGDYTIETYNPNNPYSTGENHNDQVLASRILVHASNNTYQLGDGKEHSGGLTDITVFPYSLFDHPTPPLGLGILDVVFGGTQGAGIKTTQITDAAGHHLLNPNGTWNVDARTRIPNSVALPTYGRVVPGSLVTALARTGTYTQTIENHGGGTYQLNLAGKDFGVQLRSVPSKAGDQETITYSPAGGHFGFTTSAASKPIDVQVLVRHADQSVRTAHVTGAGLRNSALEMGFDAAKESFTYRHAGQAGQINVRLVHTLYRGATTEVKLAPIAVKHGDAVTFSPNWKTLKTANPGMLQIKDAAGAIRKLKLQ